MVVVAALGAAACKPSSVAEAEARGNIQWLDEEGSAAAVEAIGRLADKDPAAVELLKTRASHDVTAYIAAWSGVKRGQRWAVVLMHAGLQDLERAEQVASAVNGQDPAVVQFEPDVAASLERLAATGATSRLAAVLASIGPQAHADVVKRLADKASRGSMCGGIANASASDDARAALRSVPADSRDDATCVTSVATIAATDDPTLHWLAREAEPGLLGAASKLTLIDCARVQLLWTEAIATRAAALGTAMTVPLATALKRCPQTMDGVVADAIRSKPDAVSAAVRAIEPFSADDQRLRATCMALPLVARSGATAVAKERANDALDHGCKGVN
jgi:hypothetical protein